MTIQQVQQLAQTKLSTKRYHHVENVVAAATILAKRFGADVEKAQLAAWLHDLVKEETTTSLLQMLEQDAIMAELMKKSPKPVWHGPCGAIYAKNTLGIQDEEVLSAVAVHTTGKKGMSILDKVVLVADMISEERNYPGVDEIRSFANYDLDKATLASLQHTVSFVKQRDLELDPRSLEAIEDLESKISSR